MIIMLWAVCAVALTLMCLVEIFLDFFTGAIDSHQNGFMVMTYLSFFLMFLGLISEWFVAWMFPGHGIPFLHVM